MRRTPRPAIAALALLTACVPSDPNGKHADIPAHGVAADETTHQAAGDGTATQADEQARLESRVAKLEAEVADLKAARSHADRTADDRGGRGDAQADDTSTDDGGEASAEDAPPPPASRADRLGGELHLP